ncbi:hypothetical protein BKA69DRAFT_607175 [Paraphysoderma sedebokerense]|nr:hypothetical protein BKA69DRAFT_607175 [Paraphysoderma sedebokerense]
MEELLRKALDERKKTVVKSEPSSSSRNIGSEAEIKEPAVTVKAEELEPPSRPTVEEEQHSGKENDSNRVVGESEVSETEPESDAEAFPAKRKGPSPHKPAKRIKLDDSPSPKSKSPEKVQISSTVPTKPTLAESKPLPKAKAASPISDTPGTAETKTRPPVKPAEVKKSEPPPSSVLPPTQQRATLSRSGSQEPVAHSSKSRSSVSEATNDSVSSKPVRDSTVKVKKKVKRPFLMGISGYQKIGMEQPVVVSTPSIREDEGKTYFDDQSKEKSKADGSVTPARVKEEIEVKMEVVEEPLTVKPSTDVKEKSVAPSATAMLPSKSAKDSGDSMDVNEDSTLNVSPKQKVPRRPSPSRDPLPPNKKVKLAHPDSIAPPSVPPSTKPISSHAVYFPLYTIQIPPSTCYYLLDIQLSLLLNLSSPMEFISQHETVTVREATLSEKKSLKSTVIADFVSKHWKNRQGKKTKELLSSDLESLSMRFLRLDQVLVNPRPSQSSLQN